MNAVFTVGWNPLSNELSVTYNGNELTKNPMSRFATFAGRDCGEWLWQFPQACADASGSVRGYTVDFIGDALFAEALRATLPGIRVNDARRKPTPVTMAHRVRWATELGRVIGWNFQLSNLRVWRGKDAGRTLQTGPVAPGHTIRTEHVTAPERADVLLVADEAEYRAVSQRLPRAKGMRLFLMPGGNLWQVRAMEEGGCLVACSAPDLPDKLRRWYETFLMPGQLRAFQRRVQTCGIPAGPDQKLLQEKQRLLTDDRPYIHLPLPAKIHAGDTSHFARTEHLPEDMKVLVSADSRFVSFRADNAIVPTTEGRCTFTLTPKDAGGVVYTDWRSTLSVDIVFPHPVTSIHLTPSGTKLLDGDRFTIRAVYMPHNADNTSQGTWQISDPAVVERRPTGEFVAKGVGSCTITHTVGTVSAQVTVQVQARANGIRIARRTQEVKLSDASRSITATILPAGAGNGQLRYTVDPRSARVLSVDRHTGRITPRDEGTAKITVELLGGAKPVNKVCEVRVVPDQRIITPHASSVLCIVLMVLVLYCKPSAYADAFMLASACIGLYGVFACHGWLTRIINLCLMAATLLLWLN